MVSVRPEVRGQLIFMAEPILHPKRPSRTPSWHSSFFTADGRAETDSYNFERRGHRMRTVLTQFETMGVHKFVVGPVRQALSSPIELPPARYK